MSTARYTLPLALLLAIGCGGYGDRPRLAEVEGVVTFEGQPVKGVLVRFECDGYRASQGLTNEAGEYRLRYIRDITGAAVGEHAVTLRDNTGRNRVPPQFSQQPLTKQVESGSNEIDFELAGEA